METYVEDDEDGVSSGPDLITHVAVHKMTVHDALKLARRTGRLPQNVNFAISAGTARNFLDANDIPYWVRLPEVELKSADVAASARAFTVSVECQK